MSLFTSCKSWKKRIKQISKGSEKTEKALKILTRHTFSCKNAHLIQSPSDLFIMFVPFLGQIKKPVSGATPLLFPSPILKALCLPFSCRLTAPHTHNVTLSAFQSTYIDLFVYKWKHQNGPERSVSSMLLLK